MTVRPRGTDRAWVQQIVVTEAMLGTGEYEDPVRLLTQYWDFDGKLLGQHDSWSPEPPWETLGSLSPGAVFITKEGILAVKSEYKYSGAADSQSLCVLLASGEYAHFPNGDMEMVRFVRLAKRNRAGGQMNTCCCGHEEDEHLANGGACEVEDCACGLYDAAPDDQEEDRERE